MAMARDIPVKKKSHRRYTVVLLLVFALLLSTVAIFFLFRNGIVTLGQPVENSGTSVDSLLSNPDAVCYTHSATYKPPQLVRNHYSAVFCDENDIQLEAAMRNGIKELPSRVSDYKKYGLVKLQDNDYYTVSELKYSVPYLVPAARVMLNTIGKCFQDVLAEKYPDSRYKIIVTSVLRTEEDVSKLVRRNRWATENSCHRHGTTIDISYHKFVKISGPDVTDWEMKEFLAKALAELRDQKICYVKYERRNCFHVTLNQLSVDGLSVTPPRMLPETKKEQDKNTQKPAKTYTNKDAERLHQIDVEKRTQKQNKEAKKTDKRPSPML